jgi:hypothetical protein
MGTSGLFSQFMSVLKDFLPVISCAFLRFEHESLPIRFFPARCAQAPANAPSVFKMPPAQ